MYRLRHATKFLRKFFYTNALKFEIHCPVRFFVLRSKQFPAKISNFFHHSGNVGRLHYCVPYTTAILCMFCLYHS